MRPYAHLTELNMGILNANCATKQAPTPPCRRLVASVDRAGMDETETMRPGTRGQVWSRDCADGRGTAEDHGDPDRDQGETNEEQTLLSVKRDLCSADIVPASCNS